MSEGIRYYIYVLRLEQSKWYIGATRNMETRMKDHFERGGGAAATRECKPVAIQEVATLIDYYIGKQPAHERAEVLVANRYAELYGYDKVRGAKHGRRWDEGPTPNQWKTIRTCQRFSSTEEGQRLLNSLTKYDFSEFGSKYCPSESMLNGLGEVKET